MLIGKVPPFSGKSQVDESITLGKSLVFLVARGGIEPPTRGFSDRAANFIFHLKTTPYDVLAELKLI
ncbi:MAG: hypothetical protein K0S27_742 [Gammaproteobacteria bacterium]|nr:hypothetical protein [Gammaproteobacteria bacterium]